MAYTHCELCGERFGTGDNGPAEMYDPKNPEAESLVVHYDCGLNKNMELA